LWVVIAFSFVTSFVYLASYKELNNEDKTTTEQETNQKEA